LTMDNASHIYVYKMTADNGGAPCVYRRMLSLAICKPEVRRTARVGDLVFGFGGRPLGGRLIYAAHVTDKPRLKVYYQDPRFRGRPDRIYRDVRGRPRRFANAQFHALSDESAKDVGPHFEKAHVLLSKDFRYFGADGTTRYQRRYKALSRMLESLGQGHRVNLDAKVRKELLRLRRELWRHFPAGKNGQPSDADFSRRCNTETPSARCSGCPPQRVRRRRRPLVGG
jgi:hypothetical protein